MSIDQIPMSNKGMSNDKFPMSNEQDFIRLGESNYSHSALRAPTSDLRQTTPIPNSDLRIPTSAWRIPSSELRHPIQKPPSSVKTRVNPWLMNGFYLPVQDQTLEVTAKRESETTSGFSSRAKSVYFIRIDSECDCPSNTIASSCVSDLSTTVFML